MTIYHSSFEADVINSVANNFGVNEVFGKSEIIDYVRNNLNPEQVWPDIAELIAGDFLPDDLYEPTVLVEFVVDHYRDMLDELMRS